MLVLSLLSALSRSNDVGESGWSSQLRVLDRVRVGVGAAGAWHPLAFLVLGAPCWGLPEAGVNVL